MSIGIIVNDNLLLGAVVKHGQF